MDAAIARRRDERASLFCTSEGQKKGGRKRDGPSGKLRRQGLRDEELRRKGLRGLGDAGRQRSDSVHWLSGVEETMKHQKSQASLSTPKYSRQKQPGT